MRKWRPLNKDARPSSRARRPSSAPALALFAPVSLTSADEPLEVLVFSTLSATIEFTNVALQCQRSRSALTWPAGSAPSAAFRSLRVARSLRATDSHMSCRRAAVGVPLDDANVARARRANRQNRRPERRIPHGAQLAGGSSSITRTPGSGVKRNVLGSRPRFVRSSLKRDLGALPNRSSTAVERASPVAGSTPSSSDLVGRVRLRHEREPSPCARRSPRPSPRKCRAIRPSRARTGSAAPERNCSPTRSF